MCAFVCTQVYDATKRELESLKKQVKEAEEEGRTAKDKVSAGTLHQGENLLVFHITTQATSNDCPTSGH